VIAVDSASALLDPQIDELLLEARGLALVRELLAERGATADELEAHARALERVRAELAGRLAPVR
jgi:hypothetical protein